MSANQPENQSLNSGSSAVAAKIQNLEKLVEGLDRQNNARRKNYVVYGIALVAVCIVCFSILTRTIFQFDAQAVAELGRQEVEKQLPSGFAGLKDYLKSQAPRIVSEMLRSAIQLIPQLRVVLIQDLEERTQTFREDFEKKLVESIQEAIRNSKANIDKVGKDKSDVEKLEMLVAHVSEEFQNLSLAALQELRPHYASEMNRVQSFLVDLHHKDDHELSGRERAQKELIRTLLVLMIREEKGTK